MQFAQRADRAEVEVLAKHERLHDRRHRLRLPFELAGGREHRRGHDPRLQPGEALPLAPLHHQVFLEHRAGHGERTSVTVRSQPHVDPEDVPVGSDVRQRRNHAPPEAYEELVIAERPHVARARRSARFAVLVVDKDQVDVRRHVEFAAAELAHADDEQVLRHSVGRLSEPRGPGQVAGVHRDRALRRPARPARSSSTRPPAARTRRSRRARPATRSRGVAAVARRRHIVPRRPAPHRASRVRLPCAKQTTRTVPTRRAMPRAASGSSPASLCSVRSTKCDSDGTIARVRRARPATHVRSGSMDLVHSCSAVELSREGRCDRVPVVPPSPRSDRKARGQTGAATGSIPAFYGAPAQVHLLLSSPSPLAPCPTSRAPAPPSPPGDSRGSRPTLAAELGATAHRIEHAVEETLEHGIEAAEHGIAVAEQSIVRRFGIGALRRCARRCASCSGRWWPPTSRSATLLIVTRYTSCRASTVAAADRRTSQAAR